MHMQINVDKKHLMLGIIACVMGGFFYCYEFILRIIPGALQSELSAAFGHIPASLFGQIAALYYFAYSPMQIPVGMLMDRFGPRRLLTFASLCCTLGSLMFGFSQSLGIVGCGRFLVGFGSSFAFVGVLSLAVHWLPPRFFSLVTGLVTTLGMLGVVYGEVEVTHLAGSWGLSHVMEMTVAAGIALTGMIFLIVRDGPGGRDVRTQPLRSFFSEVARVLVSPNVWVIGIIGACLYTSLSVFGELWGKMYLEQAHHLSSMDAAKSISLMFLGWAVGAPLSGYWSDQTGRRVRPLVIGAIVAFIAMSFVLYYPGLTHTQLNVLLFIYGLASGVEILVFIMGKEHSDTPISGTVFAVVNMIVSLGGVIFQPLVGWLLDHWGHRQWVQGKYIYLAQDYQIALSVLPLSLIFVILSGFFIKDKVMKK